MDSVVSGISPAETGDWPSSTRLASKITHFNEDGLGEIGLCSGNASITKTFI